MMSSAASTQKGQSRLACCNLAAQVNACTASHLRLSWSTGSGRPAHQLRSPRVAHIPKLRPKSGRWERDFIYPCNRALARDAASADSAITSSWSISGLPARHGRDPWLAMTESLCTRMTTVCEREVREVRVPRSASCLAAEWSRPAPWIGVTGDLAVKFSCGARHQGAFIQRLKM